MPETFAELIEYLKLRKSGITNSELGMIFPGDFGIPPDCFILFIPFEDWKKTVPD